MKNSAEIFGEYASGFDKLKKRFFSGEPAKNKKSVFSPEVNSGHVIGG